MHLLVALLPLLAPGLGPDPGLDPAPGLEPAAQDVSETVVVAPRSKRAVLPSTTRVLTVSGEELRESGERSLPRAIGRTTGVWIQETNLGGGSPIVRGLVGNRILIVVDGVRLNDSTTREGPNQSLNQIDPATIDRVEIVRGPMSVLYGSDALGGVILVWTRRSAPAGSAETEVGLDGWVEGLYRTASSGGRGSLGVSVTTESFGALGIGSIQDWDDLVAGNGERQRYTGYDGWAGFASLEYAFDRYRNVRGVFSRNREEDVPRTDRLVPGFGQTTAPDQIRNFAVQDRSRAVLAYTDRDANALGDEFQLRASVRSYREERERLPTGSTTFRNETDEVLTTGLGFDWRKALGDDHLLTYGLDVDVDWVDSRRTDTDLMTSISTARDGQFAPDSSYLSTGLFVQDEIFAFEPFELTAGLRFSYFAFDFDDFPSQGTGSTRGDFSAVTASLQAARQVNERLRLFGGLGQGFRAPNLADLAKNGTFASGVELANPDLDPERSVMLELGADYTAESYGLGASTYFQRITDLIGRVLIDPGNPGMTGDEIFMRENVGQADIYGLELEGWRRLGDDDSPFRGELSAVYTRGEQEDDETLDSMGNLAFDGVPFRRIPPLHGRVGVSYRPADPKGGFLGWSRLELQWAWEQDRLHPEDIGDPRIDPAGTPGWAIVNADLGGPLGKLDGGTWQLGVHNLFDREYRVHASGFDAPGLGLVFGLRLAF